MLHDFILKHRQELIERARAKVVLLDRERAPGDELSNGVPLFLTQLAIVLRDGVVSSVPHGAEMGSSATRHGGDLLDHGFSIAQVVHDYGDVCQAITELAVELRAPITTEEFHTLNRCLDDAIAHAVTEYARRRDVDDAGAEVRRQGFFVHELQNHVCTAALALELVKSGRVGVAGSTIGVLERSLRALSGLIDHAVSDVRLASGTHHRERLRVADLIEQFEIDYSLVILGRGQRLSVERVARGVFIEVDPQLFQSAVSNLLRNAFKFTPRSGHVQLRARSTPDRVWIEIEDECGGMRADDVESIFEPFVQMGADHAGLGLGLPISHRAIETDGGTISVRNLPGQGCIFVVEMPRAADETDDGVGSRSESRGGSS